MFDLKYLNGTCGSAKDPPKQCDVDGLICDMRAGQYYDECGILKKIMPCLNPEACIGTALANYSNITCNATAGYQGPLCQTCDVKRGFFMTTNGCETCAQKLPAEIRLIILFTGILTVAYLARKIMKKLNKHRKYDVVLRHVTELVVVLFDFMQIAGSMSSLYSIKMPRYLKAFFSQTNIVNFDLVDILGLNCFGEDVTFYAAFTMTMMIPLLVLFCCYVAYWATSRVAKLKMKLLKSENMGWGRLVRMLTLEAQKQRDRKSRFSVIALSVLSLLYMPLTVRCFRFFQCIRIDDKDYLMADFREECYTKIWLGFIFIAVCVIVMYCLLFPIGIFYTLFKIRKKLDSLHVQHKYGFLYNQYKLPSYWWESAAILRKLLLASVPVFMHEHPILQLTISIIVSIIFHLLHSTWHPYELYNVNLLQHLTFAGTWLTFFLLLLQWNFRDQGYEQTAQNVVDGTIGFNICILVAAVYIISNTIRTELRLLKTRVEVDITISKSLTSSLKGKLNKIAKRSKAHVKARQLEIEAEKARMVADKHGGNHSKRWNKLSLMTKLGSMHKHNTLSSTHSTLKLGLHHEATEDHADRLIRESSVHHKRRRASLALGQENGRAKIMERLKLRAKAKKARVLDKVQLFENLSRKSKNSVVRIFFVCLFVSHFVILALILQNMKY